ncbi:LacI family DNA-binding transcriptional regulator [Brevibacterium antiquum]
MTLQQVADRAQVSRSAASFALSGRPGVSESTRSRVLAIAAELGYSPNRTAQNLRSSRTGIVAVYLPKDVSVLSYYMEATFGIIDEAELSDHTVTFVPHSAESAARLRADGVIILDPTLDDPVIPRLLELGLPVISGEEMPQESAQLTGTVTSDHAGSTEEILDAFAAAGAHSPAIISPEERMSWSMTIEDAYRKWCGDHGVETRIESASLDGMSETTRRATKRLLESGEVDAILALTDGSVLTVVTSAASHGRTLGTDLLVAAAVDSPVLGYMDPPVTAVDLRPREFGRACMRLLTRALDSSDSRGDGRAPHAEGIQTAATSAEETDALQQSVETHVIHRDSTAGPLHRPRSTDSTTPPATPEERS